MTLETITHYKVRLFKLIMRVTKVTLQDIIGGQYEEPSAVIKGDHNITDNTTWDYRK